MLGCGAPASAARTVSASPASEHVLYALCKLRSLSILFPSAAVRLVLAMRPALAAAALCVAAVVLSLAFPPPAAAAAARSPSPLAMYVNGKLTEPRSCLVRWRSLALTWRALPS